ncbi:hypothetical protein ACHAPA_006618 [Fusarium lateritium]
MVLARNTSDPMLDEGPQELSLSIELHEFTLFIEPLDLKDAKLHLAIPEADRVYRRAIMLLLC